MQSTQMAVQRLGVRRGLLCDGIGISLLISGSHPIDVYLHTDDKRPQQHHAPNYAPIAVPVHSCIHRMLAKRIDVFHYRINWNIETVKSEIRLSM